MAHIYLDYLDRKMALRGILLTSIAPLFLFAADPSLAADEAKTLVEAITQGKANINFRYRYENVDQDGFAEQANASTLRTKLKYATKPFKGFSGVIEFDNVTRIGAGNYNSTINGKGQFPVVADPQITAVNQAYIAYTGFKNTTLLAGRTALNIDNQRFVGTVGFRQNDQTWDMAGIISKPTENLTLTGGYVWNVNRIFGDEHPFGDLDTNTFLLNSKYTGLALGNITAYGLFIDLNDAAVFGLSSQTLGVRFDGKHKFANGNLTALYEAEFATQSDYKDSPLDYNAQYYHLSAGLSANGWTGKVGYEVLGSDNGIASFQTPLATLHKFNGWADKFLSTPAGGLQDFYGSLFYKFAGDSSVKGLTFGAIYHDFTADIGGDYGSEINLVVKKKIGKNYYGSLIFADYNASGFATDTQKFWITIGADF
ncbi:hypothetical protein MNBD_ALPHA06-2019 [hydrothermal vent metagenome]|uniref:Alginate export domain-containing protein n=1 Tax=hydrothermal vent metagenome TaxID=652676 RepID=A0A3B0RR18_9ZZZZ